MKYLRLDGGETLDLAYEKLKQMEADINRNSRSIQTVYMVFNGKKVVSNQTLNEAYKEVYGLSKDELEEKDRQRQKATEKEEIIDTRAYLYTVRDVVEDIKISRLIKAKDPNTGYWASAVADSYIAIMNSYANYCKQITVDKWIETIVNYVHNIGLEDEKGNLIYTYEKMIAQLEFYEKLGTILKAVTMETPWSEVKSLVDSYKFNGEEIEKLKELMCFYSVNGEEFVVNVFGKGPMTYTNN
jgi:hypothetical protein